LKSFFKIFILSTILFLSTLLANAEQKKEETYNVAIFENWMPYYYVDKNGKASGFAIELFEEIAKDIGIQYKYISMTNLNEFWSLVNADKIDIIPDMSITNYRKEIMLFSESTNTFEITLYKRYQSKNLNTIKDFYNKTVAVVHKNVGVNMMKRYPQIKTRLFQSRFDAFYALLSGEVDGVCYPKPLTNYSLKKLNLEDKIIPIEENILEIKRAIGIISTNKGLDKKINESIKKLQHNGTYEIIYQKWFGKEKRLELSYEQMIYLVIIIILIVLGCLSLVIFYSMRKNWLMTEKDLKKELDIRTADLQEVNEKLKHLATVDALTNIYNRRYFYDVSKQYLEIAKRNEQEICVISFDLDKFKDINDTYGHQFGDTVLIEFTNIVNSFMRKSDLFGRIGGEEFSVVLQNTSIENSFIVAEKIRKKVQNFAIQNDDKKVHFTVSIGIVSLSTEDTIDELLEKADEALYKAKENGRNRIVKYNEI